jgi:cell pole-organizing protein PopZ
LRFGVTAGEVNRMSVTQPDPGDRDFEAARRAQRAHEPSMEEILASIRAIIADDREANAAKAAAAPTPAAAKTPAGPQIIYSSFGGARASAELPPREPAPQEGLGALGPNLPWAPRPSGETKIEPPAPPPPRPAPPPARPQAPPALERDLATAEAPLLSRESDRRVTTSFQSLAAAVAPPDPKRLEEMARDLLRPMVKAWLDENLPELVERLVRAEIERVSRGAR